MALGSDQRLSASRSLDTLTRHRFLPTKAAVIELIVLFGVILVCGRLLMAPAEFAKLQPHPFWLPVILLSLQYGTAEGVLASVVAIIAALFIGWPSQGVDEEYYRYVIRVWAVPIGWIVSSIVIGEIRARQRSRMMMLERDLLDEHVRSGDITEHCHRLEEKIARLEREFAIVEASSVNALAANFQDLARGDRGDWQSALGRVHRGLLGTGTLAVLLRDDRGVVRVARVETPGEAMTAEPPPSAALAAVVEAVTANRRPLNAMRSEDARVLDGVAAMAYPVSSETIGRALGVAILETIAPDQLTVDTENKLALLARELAHALAARGSKDLIDAAVAEGDVIVHAAGSVDEAGDESGLPKRVGLFQRFGRA